MRKYVGPVLFEIFNWTFISFCQVVLLYLLASPAYVILLSTQFDPDIQASDIAYVAIQIGLILVEVIADQQQWSKSHLYPISNQYLTVGLSQAFKTQRKSTKRQPRFPPVLSKPSSTSALHRPDFGASADTPTLPPSRPFGSCSTNGAATPPSRSTIGLLSGLRLWFSCSSLRRGSRS